MRKRKTLFQDAYLELAKKILYQKFTPMSASEIINFSVKMNLLPNHLKGATKHKTLQARISEDIISFGRDSEFYRVSPGRFFLRRFMEDPLTHEDWRLEYFAERRKRHLGKDKVVLFPKKFLSNAMKGEIYNDVFDDKNWIFVERKDSSKYEDALLICTFTVIRKPEMVLSYTHGIYTLGDNETSERKSIGFEYTITDADINLMNRGVDIFKNNAARNILRNIDLDKYFDSDLSMQRRLHFLDVLHDEDIDKIGVFLEFHEANSDFFQPPQRKSLSLGSVRWISSKILPNDLHNYDTWSQRILRYYSEEGGF